MLLFSKIIFLLVIAVIMALSFKLIKTLKIEYSSAPLQLKYIYVYRMLVIIILDSILLIMLYHINMLINIFNLFLTLQK